MSARARTAADAAAHALLEKLLEVPEFRTRWEAQDVRHHTAGVKCVDHPVVGGMDLRYENLRVDADEGVSVLTFSPDPGIPLADAMVLLGHWARDGGRMRSQ